MPSVAGWGPLLSTSARHAAALLKTVSWAMCVFYLGFLVIAIVVRFTYADPLEWLEPATASIVARILHGLPVYCEPTYLYVPTMKTPLYYYVVALVALPFGNGMMTARLVSILATLGTFVIVWRFIRREGAGRRWALLGVGLYAATYGVSEHWYDLARLDPLFLMFLMGGIYGLRFWSGWRGAVAAGLVLAMAYFTKQTALMVALPALAGLTPGAWRRALVAAATFAAAIGLGMAALHLSTGGWSTFFLTEVPAHGDAAWINVDQLVGGDLLGLVPAMIAFLALIMLSRRDADRRVWFYAGLGIGALVAGSAGRIHLGGAANALMPLYATLAVAMPLAAKRLLDLCPDRLWFRVALPPVVQGLILLQFVTVCVAVGPAFPGAGDRHDSQVVEAFLRSIDGDVLVMDDRFYAGLAGKASPGLDYSMTDLLLDARSPATIRFRETLLDVLRSGRFAGVVDPPDFVLEALSFDEPIVIEPPPPAGRFDPFRPRTERYYPLRRP